jgi:glutamate synthase (NADPH/NADH) large chain
VIEPRDAGLLHNLVQRHLDLTGSKRARHILDNWSDILPRFIKIFPHEFKRVIGVTRTRQQYIPGQPLPLPELVEALHG